MKWKIITDSGCDIHFMDTASEDISYACVPLKIIVGDYEYIDDGNTDISVLLQKLAEYKGKTSSACPSPGDYQHEFEGADNIIIFTLTAKLSGSYNSALLARKMYLEDHPDKKIYVMNSLSAGAKMTFLAHKAIDHIKDGMNFEEVTEALENDRKNIKFYFALKSVQNLINNGRLPKPIGLAIGALKIRLFSIIGEDGAISVIDKCRGYNKTAKKFLDKLEEDKYNGGKIFLAHCNNNEEVNELKKSILEKYPNAEISISQTGGICSYYAENQCILISFES